LVDKEIRKGFKAIRATITAQEKEILKADIRADRERARLKRKLQKS
jgi:hypothetical protein